MTIAQYLTPRKLPAIQAVDPTPRKPRRPSSPTRHLTHTQFASLLAFIDDEGGIATLDGIPRALPQVVQPISAVYDLFDAGILSVDFEAAFDGDMHVWRIDG